MKVSENCLPSKLSLDMSYSFQFQNKFKFVSKISFYIKNSTILPKKPNTFLRLKTSNAINRMRVRALHKFQEIFD